ncbi:MAG: GGDEF domain-containing protein [Planctomycetes bacterium]|nr:GGDEF domain-containing protein [Planctomycetota bacterium]
MRLRRPDWLPALALVALPALTGAAVLAAWLSRPSDPSAWPFSTRFLAVTAALCAAYAGLLLALHRRSRAALLRTTAELERVRKEDEGSRRRLMAVEERLEILSAYKNVTAVLTSDVGFERILDETLRITADLLGRTRFARDLSRKSVNRAGVEECVEFRQIQRVSDGERFILAVPLTADQETIGAVQVGIPTRGAAGEIVARAEHIERSLSEILGTLALAIKTPDLYTRTITDALTGLFTKRHFITELETHFEAARRHGDALSLIMIDIDHFKKVNDTYGHVTGDIVLKKVASVVKSSIRAYALAFRYGGEEMALIIPRADTSAALAAAERIRKRVEGKRIAGTKKESIAVTISLGIAEFTPNLRGAVDLVGRADAALYQSKDSGRNRSTVWVPAEAAASRG